MTTDPIERLTEAGRHVDPHWREPELRRTWPGVARKRRRRLVVRAGQAAALAVLVLAAVRLGHVQAPMAGLRLHDGSLATPLEPGTELVTVEDGARAALIELRRGRGRFQVVHTDGRTFSVRAGEVTVRVLGTIFAVERIADRIGVTVERGHVQVEWPGGARSLVAGESGWFPPLDGAGAARLQAPGASGSREFARPLSLALPPADRGEETGVLPSPPSAGETKPEGTGAPSPSPRSAGERVGVRGRDRFVSPAASDRSQTSSAGSTREHPAAESDTASAHPPAAVATSAAGGPGAAAHLLAEADAARDEGRLAEAATLLGRVVDRHADDARAPLAAFTLGRLLLAELGRPAEAAAAFARARALAPTGALAEDALAREVEAWSAAGEPARARARGEEYLRLYPAGRRLPAVRAASGLE